MTNRVRRMPIARPSRSRLPEAIKPLTTWGVGEKTGVPFFFVSASELIATEDGVHADRIRNVPELVRSVAPAILIIDELDAIGQVCDGAATSDRGKRWQPVQQLFAEVDRLNGTEGVVVLAATDVSNPRVPALVRLGRPDRMTTVTPPDLDGRNRILHAYTRLVPLAEDVDLEELASATPDMVATDLGGLITEAALLAASRNHSRVTRPDFSDALEQLTPGTP